MAPLHETTDHTDFATIQDEHAPGLFNTTADHVSVAKTLGKVALLHQKDGRFDEAIGPFKQALAGYESV